MPYPIASTPSGVAEGYANRRPGEVESVSSAEVPPTKPDGSIDESALSGYLASQLGLEVGADGAVVDKVGSARGVTKSEGASEVFTTEATTLGAPNVERVAFGIEEQEGARSFQQQVSQAFDEVFLAGTDASGNKVYKDLSEVSSDDLVAVFMKLGISDPANDPRAAEALMEVAKNIKKLALEEQAAKLTEKIEKAQEAEAKGDYAKVMSFVAAAVVVAVAVVLSVVTFGSATAGCVAAAVIVCGALLGGAIADATGGKFMDGFMMGATIAAAVVTAVVTLGSSSAVVAAMFAGKAASSAAATATAYLGVGATLVNAALQVTTAVAKKQAADAHAEAQLLGVDADKLQMMAEERQKEIEAMQKLVRVIMEGKTALMDAVLKMLNNKGAANERIMSIGVSRA